MNGLFSELRQNALGTIAERTQNKHQNLLLEMTTDWSSLSGSSYKIMDLISMHLADEGKTFADIETDAELNENLLLTIAQELIARIRSNNTAGVFVVLNGPGMETGAEQTYAGLCIRDNDPEEEEADNGDLRVVRGSLAAADALNLYRNEADQTDYTFPGGRENADNDYFFRPLLAALGGETVFFAQPPLPMGEFPSMQSGATGVIPTDAINSGYWSLPFIPYGRQSGQIITYSEPLISQDGIVYGVLAVEITLKQITEKLATGEFARTGRGCYYLGVTEDGGATYRKVATGGDMYLQLFDEEQTTLTVENKDEDGWITVQSQLNGETVVGSVQTMPLYVGNSAFSNQQWVLIGMADEATLYSFVYTVRNVFMTAALLAVLMGAGIAAFSGRRVVQPIVRLSNSLKNSDPNQELKLAPTNIDEIDRLADAIMALNHDVIESATRLSKIIKLADLPIGVFEIRDDSEMAYCSDKVFALLGQNGIQVENNTLPKTICMNSVNRAMGKKLEDSVYLLENERDKRYVRIKLMREEHGVVGTIMDVTDEMNDRQRLERELDYDLLTGILNRRAFENEVGALLKKDGATVGVAAMIMLDLDNLKFLNDTYGHDCGDGYIRSLAEALRLFGDENALYSRRSGDEFYTFLYGAQDKRQLRKRIDAAWKNITAYSYSLPDGKEYKMRVSGGIAWYPDDAKTLPQLIRYADFAMFKVKRNEKGSLADFNEKDYSENAFLISGRNALDRLIDGGLIRFMLQPILSARTGNTVGYELLMRTDESELPTPKTVLKLASAEGKLQHIERLTWFKGLETVTSLIQNDAVSTDVSFFLNSIANQALSREDERTIAKRFAAILPRLVIEVTESERNDKNCTEQKIRFIKNYGGRVAIDDYGTGYNSELSLVKIDADIVKLDISFVRDVDKDADKQALIQNLISFARRRQIAVLAEGVETHLEMRTLIRFGVDYLQGYYTGMPQYQPVPTDERIREEIRRFSGIS